MGILSSFMPLGLRKALIRVILSAVRFVLPPVRALFERLALSPGVPVSNPSASYWTLHPSPIAKHGSDTEAPLPQHADIVIIGSGITGLSFARAILDHRQPANDKPLQVVMLEARDACSGATGRNGGHITPVLYLEYKQLKEQYGPEMAKKIIRFRLAHLPELLAAATEELLLEESQCREVEAFDVFFDRRFHKSAKLKLDEFRNDMPEEGATFKLYEDSESIKNLQLPESAVGGISTRGGAVHPYRLVTGILKRLLRDYSSNFHLFTHTPCIGIESPRALEGYSVQTPKGIICTPHVVHATNAWVSHLVPGMRERIIPGRGVMTAQKPCAALGRSSNTGQQPEGTTQRAWAGTRSFVFYPSNSDYIFDYLTQQPLPPESQNGSGRDYYPAPCGEVMLGGGFARDRQYLTEIGNANDSTWDRATSEFLSKALPTYFDRKEEGDSESEVLSTWSGIIALSTDGRPWVGRIPDEVTGRTARSMEGGSGGLAAPGEWMAGGYSGEGMTHAWLSGKALAHMVLGREEVGEWLPEAFMMTKERWKAGGIDEVFASLL